MKDSAGKGRTGTAQLSPALTCMHSLQTNDLLGLNVDGRDGVVCLNRVKGVDVF